MPSIALAIIFGLNTYIAQTMSPQKALFILAWLFINTAVIPVLFTAFLKWKGMISSIQLHTRKDRLLPFAFAMFLYFMNYYLMKGLPMPQVIYAVFLGISLIATSAFILTFYTKISLHMLGMGGLTATVYGFSQIYDLESLALLLGIVMLSGIVGTARSFLGAHTLNQIYGGWLFGFLLVYIPINLGWG
ncbi:MAG: hypothetical protein WEC59_06895 [Salibacteraceae bacterium]